jgi:SAM-dependent methyltransferase
MIIHKLIAGVLKRRGCYVEFFLEQALDSIEWLKRCGVRLDAKTTVLDLGCGFGYFGGELAKLGCRVTLADDDSFILPEYAQLPFRRVNIDQDELQKIGHYDLVIFSNVLEHLSKPDRLLASIPTLLKPGGKFYLSWTPWCSPWGGHEFSPFHYFGPAFGYWFYTRILKKPAQHVPYQNLFPTYVGRTLRTLRKNPNLRIARIVPRYYPEFSFLMRLPIIREFLAWNCAMLIEKRN